MAGMSNSGYKYWFIIYKNVRQVFGIFFFDVVLSYSMRSEPHIKFIISSVLYKCKQFEGYSSASVLVSHHISDTKRNWWFTFLYTSLFWKWEATWLHFEVIFCTAYKHNEREIVVEREKRLKQARGVKQVGEKKEVTNEWKSDSAKGEGTTLALWERSEKQNVGGEKREKKRVLLAAVVWVCSLRANNISLFLSVSCTLWDKVERTQRAGVNHVRSVYVCV